MVTVPSEKVIPPEQLSQMVDLLPSVTSLRELGAITGYRLETVRRAMAPFLAIMKLQGTHPQCGCGRDRFHPYGCADSYVKAARPDWLPGRTLAQSAILLARRKAIIERMLDGESYADIELAFALPRRSAKGYLRFLTAEQRDTRHRRKAERAAHDTTERSQA